VSINKWFLNISILLVPQVTTKIEESYYLFFILVHDKVRWLWNDDFEFTRWESSWFHLFEWKRSQFRFRKLDYHKAQEGDKTLLLW